jgi:hypothetical protein
MTYGWPAPRILEGYGEHLRKTPKYTRPGALIRSGVDVQDMNRQCFEFVDGLGFVLVDSLMKLAYGSRRAVPEEDRPSVEAFEFNLRDFLKDHPWEPKDRREDRGFMPKEAKPLPEMAEKYGVPPQTLGEWCSKGMPHYRSGKKLLYIQESVVKKWMKKDYRDKIFKSRKRNRSKQSKMGSESARSAA